MVFVHTSTHIPLKDDMELQPETVPQSLRTCAETLRSIADSYSKMADVIETKNIKIGEVGGTASIGSFEVDEIDAGRLRVAGLLYDVRAKTETAPTPEGNPVAPSPETEDDDTSYDHPFFIDPIYDEINARIDQMEHVYYDDLPEEDLNKAPVEFSAENPDWPVEGGEAAVDVKMSYDPESGQVKFDFNILDVGESLEDIDYDPETQSFSYFCSTCDKEHTESLVQVHNSLRVVTGMIGQLNKINNPERAQISEAFQTLEDNLRLLLHFVAMHLDEEEDDHSECDHDHDEENDEEIL